MKRFYRVEIEHEAEYSEEFKSDVVEFEKVMALLNKLEQDANEIRDLLQPFVGLTEIREIYEKAFDLSEKLY